MNHGGSIRCTSTQGKGTRFDVYLPELGPADDVREATDEEPPVKGAERILFVDDEPVLAELGKKMLEDLGYTVVACTSSSDALELFRRDSNMFDLVITDMTMPGMTGDRLARRIMEIRPEIPVILCTGYSKHITEAGAKDQGIREYVMKPLELRGLAQTIRKALRAS
jgi:CheY-like chemotaxis protein